MWDEARSRELSSLALSTLEFAETQRKPDQSVVDVANKCTGGGRPAREAVKNLDYTLYSQ